MKFTTQFFGGILVGLAFGIMLGAALLEGFDKDARFVVPALILVIAGMALARRGFAKT